MSDKKYGKGSSPRNCFSKQFKNNYEEINWSNKRFCEECQKELNKEDLFEYCGDCLNSNKEDGWDYDSLHETWSRIENGRRVWYDKKPN